ncbi:MAG TPA: nitroreductase family protein [Syntrophobacteria bacterium]|nr:nitroreductase family protein [Syntrophobacteria bacterium]
MQPFEHSLDEVIQRRRSIRKYTPEVPPVSWIEAMVACAARAPSPSNSQPVRFIRITSPRIQHDLHRGMRERYEDLLRTLDERAGSKKTRNLINACFRYSEFMFDAPVIIAAGTATNVAGFTRKLAEANVVSEDGKAERDLDIALGLALKGFVLKGTALGLGTCILTAPLVFLSDLERRIGVEDLRIKCFVTIGFPAEKPSFVERRSASEIYLEV